MRLVSIVAASLLFLSSLAHAQTRVASQAALDAEIAARIAGQGQVAISTTAQAATNISIAASTTTIAFGLASLTAAVDSTTNTLNTNKFDKAGGTISGQVTINSTFTVLGTDSSGFSVSFSSGIRAQCITLQGGQICGPSSGGLATVSVDGTMGGNGSAGAPLGVNFSTITTALSGKLSNTSAVPTNLIDLSTVTSAITAAVLVETNRATTRENSIGTSTGTIYSSLNSTAAALSSLAQAVGISTAQARLDLNSIAVSTTAQAVTNAAVSASTTQVAVDTTSLAGRLVQVASSTNTLSASTASISSSLSAEIIRATARENDIGSSTGTIYAALNSTASALTNGLKAVGISTAQARTDLNSVAVSTTAQAVTNTAIAVATTNATTGSGAVNIVPVWTGTKTLGSSHLTDDGTNFYLDLSALGGAVTMTSGYGFEDNGGDFSIIAASGVVNGGNVYLEGGLGRTAPDGSGGGVYLYGGSSVDGATGGPVFIQSGSGGTGGTGGDITSMTGDGTLANGQYDWFIGSSIVKMHLGRDGRLGVNNNGAAAGATLGVTGTGIFTMSVKASSFVATGQIIAIGSVTVNGAAGLSVRYGVTSATVTTSGQAVIGGSETVKAGLSVYGVILSSTSQGTLTCTAGTGIMSATCTDRHCTYAAGTLATSCTYTFGTAWPKKPDCWCGTDAATPLAVSAITATNTIQCTAGASVLTGDNITFLCESAP